MIFIILLLLGLSLFSVIDNTVVFTILKLHFILYLFIIIFNYYKTRTVNLMQVWILAFIYIIWSDMIILAEGDYMHQYSWPIAFYLIANNLVLLGYFIRKKSYVNKDQILIVSNPIAIRWYIGLALIIYIFFNIEDVIQSFNKGRILLDTSQGVTTLFGEIVGAIGMLTPAIIAYYFRFIKRKNIIWSILFSFPFLIFSFILATRFAFLYTILPFLIVSGIIELTKVNTRRIIVAGILMVAISIGSEFTLQTRSEGVAAILEGEESEVLDENVHTKDFFVKIANRMSPEGVVEMTRIANDYFSNHELRYGRESSFIFFFWIPRSWWPDKPTQLDHWMIRTQYDNVGDNFSTASGFIGELRADFGLLSLIFAVLIGLMLRNLDMYTLRILSKSNESFNIILIAMLFPYFFFFVRSPLTATFSLIFELVLFYILIFVCCKRIKV